MDEPMLDAIIARYTAPSGRTLGVLREVQEQEGYISREMLVMLSEKLDVRLSHLAGLVTFYSFFSTRPVGDHLVTVCMGTACHVKGAVQVLEKLEAMLGVMCTATVDGKLSATTEDNQFTLEIARCFGACSMAPVFRVDGNLYGYARPEDLPDILSGYGWER